MIVYRYKKILPRFQLNRIYSCYWRDGCHLGYYFYQFFYEEHARDFGQRDETDCRDLERGAEQIRRAGRRDELGRSF